MLFRIDPAACVAECLNLGKVWRTATGVVRPFGPHDLEGGAFLFEGENFEDFEPLARTLYQRDRLAAEHTESGWISPEGDYYGCAATSSMRLQFLERVLERNAIDALRGGWIEVSSRGWSQDASHQPNDAQKKALEKIGRDPDNRNGMVRAVRYEEAFPDGNGAMEGVYNRLNALIEEESARFARPVSVSPQALSCQTLAR
ncbi:MAG: hypothetical protein EOM26_09405 [Alphaproteobacteria bacterium]|nr:hypothetical protein [Alphaproteobacteria bacterium]